VTRQILVDNLLRMLPWVLDGFAFAVWGTLMLWIGYSRGWRRGVKDRPDVQRNALAEENHKRVVAQERLESAEKVIRYYKTVIDQLAAKGER